MMKILLYDSFDEHVEVVRRDKLQLCYGWRGESDISTVFCGGGNATVSRTAAAAV